MRACAYDRCPSRIRAEPKTVTAGTATASTASNPARNSSAMRSTWDRERPSCGCSRISRSRVATRSALPRARAR